MRGGYKKFGSERFDGGYNNGSYGSGDSYQTGGRGKKGLGADLHEISWDTSTLIPFEKNFYAPTAKVNAR